MMNAKLLGLCAAVGIVLSVGTANADTFDISITPGFGGTNLTGTIDLNTSTGLFNSLNLSGGCLIPGDPTSCGFRDTRTALTFVTVPSNSEYQYQGLNPGPGQVNVATEGYDLASQTYEFSFGVQAVGELDLEISLASGTIFASYTNDACDGPNCPNIFGEGSGVISAATPLPAALPLFATGLGAMGLFGWRRKRKSIATSH